MPEGEATVESDAEATAAVGIAAADDAGAVAESAEETSAAS